MLRHIKSTTISSLISLHGYHAHILPNPKWKEPKRVWEGWPFSCTHSLLPSTLPGCFQTRERMCVSHHLITKTIRTIIIIMSSSGYRASRTDSKRAHVRIFVCVCVRVLHLAMIYQLEATCFHM